MLTMKKTFQITKSLLTKLIVGVLLLAVLGSVLVSCGGGTQKISISGVARDEASQLTQDNLDKLATALANNSEAYVAFVAAYRGYNMLAEGFDKTIDRPGVKDENGNYVSDVEAAKQVIAKYDTDKVLTYDKLSAKDMENIITKLKTDITINSQRGIFENIQYWIGVALNWMTNTLGFGNYLVGICLFAIIIEILLLPMGIKQQKNSIKQARLRPKEMAIRKKYAGRNDQATQQKVSAEIQELYQRENFNPMSGCFQLLIQFPIIIVLYNIVINPLVYVLGKSSSVAMALQSYFVTAKAAGGLGMTVSSQNGTIEILSKVKEMGDGALEGIKDFLFISNGAAVHEELQGISQSIPSFNIGPVNFGLTPNFQPTDAINYVLLLVPVLTFVVYFFSMKLTKKFTYQPTTNDANAMGCSTKMMDITMPLMSVFFTFIVPGVVGMYWIFKSVLGTLKSFILSRVMPLPKFTEEDYKAAERELNAKNPPKKRSGGGSGAKVRSLHHIDDEDYEDTPAPTQQKASKKPTAEIKAEASESKLEESEKKESPIERAPLKKDDDKNKKD